MNLEIFPAKKADKIEDIKKKLLKEGDPRETLLFLFDKLEDDYDLVEKVIDSLKKEKTLTDDEQEHLRAIDDVYPGALDEWIEENTPPSRRRD